MHCRISGYIPGKIVSFLLQVEAWDVRVLSLMPFKLLARVDSPDSETGYTYWSWLWSLFMQGWCWLLGLGDKISKGVCRCAEQVGSRAGSGWPGMGRVSTMWRGSWGATPACPLPAKPTPACSQTSLSSAHQRSGLHQPQSIVWQPTSITLFEMPLRPCNRCSQNEILLKPRYRLSFIYTISELLLASPDSSLSTEVIDTVLEERLQWLAESTVLIYRVELVHASLKKGHNLHVFTGSLNRRKGFSTQD